MPLQISHIKSCVCGTLCTPCAYAAAKSHFDSSNFVFNLLCVSPCIAHAVIRQGFAIRGHWMEDIAFPLCCYPCTACRLLNAVNGEIAPMNAEQISHNSRHDALPRGPAVNDWRNVLCCCTSRPWTCFYTCFCPTLAIAEAKSALDHSSFYFNLLACISPSYFRSLVREAYDISGNCVGDIVMGTVCCPLSICQAIYEIKDKGEREESFSKLRVQMRGYGALDAIAM